MNIIIIILAFIYTIFKGQFVYTGDFCWDFSGNFLLRYFVAISLRFLNRPCKLLAIPRRSESPVVYTGDLKSPRNRAWNRSKNRQCKRALKRQCNWYGGVRLFDSHFLFVHSFISIVFLVPILSGDKIYLNEGLNQSSLSCQIYSDYRWSDQSLADLNWARLELGFSSRVCSWAQLPSTRPQWPLKKPNHLR